MKELWLEYPVATPVLTIIAVTIVLLAIVYIIKDYNNNPFRYPVIQISVDLSKKRQPSYTEYIDIWINRQKNPRQDIENIYINALTSWEKECETIIKNASLWRSHKRVQYLVIKDTVVDKNYKIFEFAYYRRQTRYQTRNYQKTPYTVNNEIYRLSLSLNQMLEIDDELEEINYETTRKKWEEKNQRKLMTPELRLQIKERDNYTCQSCGKYMPDEVGLHVDHITPISKGGKSIPSNLQVLCSKCNGKKGPKIVPSSITKTDEEEEGFSFFDATW
ncbi:MAG: HNH endonuclease [Butyrivibrio sp.]|uniref:HNH endonuclease n=1 Tax=Butyrivibrio sp. TaxID=28121 RepID=UPI0025CD96F4|nr:HNH endonuclease signature motif containing protein [Butyrivibrio sp.]MCR5769758.1 HNH endonuclease [Butyrivibrio sp.]